jgi:hypothetical protein
MPNGPYPQSAYEVKRISADLDRFYRMGLLNRRKARRFIGRKRDGKELVRGWEYAYWLSRQGVKYTAYLTANIAETKDQRHSNKYKKPWQIDDATISKYALQMSLSPEEAASELIEDNKQKFQFQEYGVYKRFPRRYDKELFQKYAASRILLRRTTWELIKKEKQLKSTERREEDAKDHAKDIEKLSGKVIKMYKEETGWQLLDMAIKYFQTHNTNPLIESEFPSVILGASQSSGIPLLTLLDSVNRQLFRKGYR